MMQNIRDQLYLPEVLSILAAIGMGKERKIKRN
jgi:hypothetical protein